MKNQITKLCLQYKSEILSQNLNLTYLTSMCETLNSHCPTWPIDKSSRWLGYIQGSLMLHRISIPEHSSCFVYSSFLAGLPHLNNTHLFSPPVSRQLIMGEIIKGLCGRYLGMAKPGTKPFKCISELCLALKNHCDIWPIEQSSRWLGYIQSILIFHNLITIDSERTFSRPLFHAYYSATNQLIPPLLA